jgi:hypothetical protein
VLRPRFRGAAGRFDASGASVELGGDCYKQGGREGKRMRKVLCVIALAAAAVLVPLSTASARGPNASEQVVFSKTGAFSPSLGPFGFWIWCEADSANPYQGECNGSMYFYAFGTPKHVIDGSITELEEGQYAIHVISSSDNGASVDCTLTNSPPPTRGPTNTIAVSCTEPTSGTATADGSVVNVTGP